jgi:Tfp pilus tip-associated adhesin PilY1
MKKIQTKLERLGLSLLLALFAAASYGATTDLATAPMVSGSSFSVKPNVFLMMDDSGSMGWDYMPDPVSKFRNAYGYVSSQCNGVYYNPNIVYDPPKKADGTNYPNSSFTAAPPDGYGVTVPVTTTVNLSSQYNIGQYTTGSYSTTGGGPAYYYTYSGTLTTNASKDYYNTTSQFYQECNTALNAAVTDKITVNLNSTDAAQVSSITVDNGSGAKEILDASTGTDAPSASLATDIANHINNCTAAMTGNCTVNGFSATATNGIVTITAPDATYNGVIPVLTTTYSAATTGTLSVTVGSNTAATLPSILVAGKEILQQPINNDTTSSALANDIVNQINLCTAATAGSCTASGFSAMISGTCGRRTTTCTVIISAPASYSGNTPDVSSLTLSSTRTGRTPSGSVTATAISTGIPSGTSSVTASAFSGAAGVGLFHKVTVSTTSGPGGTDEETNFANWFSYYRTRILMMKTATGMAFNNLDSSYRVGFGTMNNNKPSSSSTKCTYCVNGNGNKFLNLAAFDATQKTAFFDMLYNSTVGNSTPLLMALSKVGLMYADKEPSNTFNNVTVVDPMEYSCQQNFTILSTDGFWNSQQNQTLTAGPTNTAVGNTDGSEPDQSKQNDGATHTYTQQTGPLQWQTDQQYTTQPLQWASDLQKTTGALQWSTDLQKATGTLQWTTDLQKASGPLQWTTDLQSATGTLQYSTDLQTASGTLQWTTDLQQTTAPLQWKTDLQTASGTLQWSTDLQTQTGALEWATNLQSATGALQWATNLQQTTAPLQWKTDLQTASGTLQWATNLQTATGALQWATNLQQTTAPLQWATNLQTATGGLQWATNLQQTAGPLMKSTPTSYTETDDTLYICTSSAANCTLDTTTYWSKAKTNTTYTCDSTTTWCETLSQYNGATSTSTSTVTSCNTAYTYNNPGTTTTGPAVQVMMACTPATWSTPTAVGPNGTCTASATTQCSVGTTSTAYVTYASPSCTVNFNAAGSNTADASGNVVTACSTAASYSTPVAVGAGNTCTGGGNVQCSTAAPAPSYVSTYPPTCSNTWNGATGSSTADGSGNVTACSTAASYSTPTATGASVSCDGTAANVQCSISSTAPAPAYVTAFPPTSNCSNTFNATGISTADGSGNVTACTTAASYNSTLTTVPASQTCTTGTDLQCSTTALTYSYVSTYPPTCSATWNGTTGTADASSQVVACQTDGGAYASPALAISSCDGSGTTPDVQCTTGTATTSYVATFPPTCSTTFNATGTSTADGSGNVVTACSPATAGTGTFNTALNNVPANTTCTTSGDLKCVGPSSFSYVTNYPPTCTASWNGTLSTTGTSGTTDSSGNVVACSDSSSGSSFNPTPTNVPVSQSCTTAGNLQCSTTTLTYSYVSTYPPTCTATWNSITNSGTADASGNVVACSGAGSGSFNPTLANVPVSTSCSTAGDLKCVGPSSFSYVTTFPPTCTPSWDGTTGTTDTSGNVVACTPATAGSGTFNPTLATVPANQICSTSGDLKCSTTALTYSYVSTYKPSCVATWNGTTGTADASSQIVACQTDGGAYGGGPHAVGASGQCDGSAADVKCSAALTPPAYVTTYPPTCSVTFTAGSLNTADAYGNVVTACTQTSPTWSTPMAVGSNGSCDGTKADVQCSTDTTAASTSYYTTYPFSCVVGFKPTATSYANNTGLVITACPVAASYDVWRDTATTSTSGDCSASTTVSCQYNWGTASSVASCASNYSTTSPYTVDPGVKCNQNVSGGTFNTLADVAEYYYTTDLRTPTLNNCSSGSTTNPGGILCSTPSLGAPDPYNNVPASGNDTASWQHMSTFTLGLGARGRMIFDPAYPQETSTSAVHDYYDINLSTAAPPTVCSWQTVGSGTCTWPIPNASGGPENIDDLWHAAIDGRGTYFSATDPTTLSTGLVNALATVRARTASAASAAISNPNVSSGDNFLFASTYTTLEWTGELVEEQINLLTGQPLTTVDPVTGQTVPVIDWSAQTELDAENWASRPIYTFDATNASGNNLKPFTWTKLTATEQAYFTSPAINALSQLCTGAANCLPVWQASYSYNVGDEYRDISTTPPTWYHVNTAYTSGATFGATDTTNASVVEGASGSNLVNFLAGDRSNEEGTVNDPTKYFRHRTHVLGDIVDSEAVYVGKPLLNFSDPGYSTYATLRQSRQPMIFVAANDGMLHAFYTASDNMDSNGYVVSSGGTAVTAGAEAWSFIPSIEMQNLYKLADKNYANQHQYFTDGTPVVTDICISNCTNSASAVWKTILVAGMNGGGRGYYALDITNPGAPKALWEFTDVADPMVSPSINTVDSNMGYSYGNPTIAKTGLGNWVVMFSSGYNNVSPGDGQGHLYVLNAYTGTLDTNVNPTGPVPGVLDTGVGSTTTPSGLARISAEVVDPQTDLTTVAVYGGDLLGNLWRFDVNGDVGASTSGYDAQLLATLLGPNGVAEPITVRPEVGIVGTSSTMVYVGTGRYLGSSDLNATDQLAPNYQNVYGIYDPLTTPSGGPSTAIYSDPRNDPTFVGQQLSLTTCPSGAPTTVCAAGSQILTSTTNTANIPTNHGWYVDFPTDASLSGLRDNTDPLLAVGTLAVNLNLPSGSSCSIGGSSYGLSIDYSNGGPVSSATFTVTDSLGFTTTYNVTGIYYGNALATHPILMTLPNGVTKLGTTLGDNTFKATDLQQGVGAGGSQRVSWRILQ